MSKIKMMMVLPTFASGGAERVMLNILNHLDREVFEPVLYLQQAEGEYLSALKEDVEIITPGSRRGLTRLLFLRREIRRIRPRIVFIMLLPIAGLAARLSASGAVTVLRETESRPKTQVHQGAFISWLNRAGMRACDLYIAPAEGAKKYLQDRYRLEADRIHVIHNPVDIARIEQLAKSPVAVDCEEFNLVAVGRLTYQKGFDLLIEALATLVEIPWRLRILGEGPDEELLRDLATQAGLAERIEFLGIQSNPYAYMAHSDLLVLSSRWEGLPNVVLEGMASGVPVLATRCPTGPDEIITPGVDGQLCEINAESIADAIRQLYEQRATLGELANAARKRIKTFDLPNIMQQYEAFFKDHSGRVTGSHG